MTVAHPTRFLSESEHVPPSSDTGVPPNFAAAVAGFVAAAGNVGAVLLLHDMPSAYRVASLDAWVAAVNAQPFWSSASAVTFTVGLLALAGWALALGARFGTRAARWGAGLIAAGAFANGIGTLTPLVQSLHVGACGPECDAVGRALLGLTLALDSLFNLALGSGLLMMAGSANREPWTHRLMLAAGLASIPVAAQAVWDPAANLLYVAAPLWLALIVKTSVSFWRGA